MKKGILVITPLILLGVISSFSHANSLVKRDAEAPSFGFTAAPIVEETKYYLRGNFTSSAWSVDSNYVFTDVTSTMSPETNKIKEYKLENVKLAKGQVLKAYGDDDTWYSTFAHHWSNGITYDGDGNYTVPMTSNSYTFYLKFYSTGKSQLYITANKDVLFFVPSTNWKSSNATMRMVFGKSSSSEDSSTSVKMTQVSSGTYKAEVPKGYSYYRYVRNSDSDSSRWNYSNMLSISNDDTNNCFSLWDTYYGTSTGIWSDWNATNNNSGTWSSK